MALSRLILMETGASEKWTIWTRVRNGVQRLGPGLKWFLHLNFLGSYFPSLGMYGYHVLVVIALSLTYLRRQRLLF